MCMSINTEDTVNPIIRNPPIIKITAASYLMAFLNAENITAEMHTKEAAIVDRSYIFRE